MFLSEKDSNGDYFIAKITGIGVSPNDKRITFFCGSLSRSYAIDADENKTKIIPNPDKETTIDNCKLHTLTISNLLVMFMHDERTDIRLF